MNLLLHPTSKKHLDVLLSRSPNSAIICGPKGSGKKALAKYISQQYLGNLSNNANFLEISPVTKSIGIDDIRSIMGFLSKKSLSSGQIKRIVLIHQAIAMTVEAQNALLKTLEEPPKDTIIIMLSDDINQLRPTIRSRSHILNILPVSQKQAINFYSDLPENQVVSAFHMASGRAGLINTLLSPDNEGLHQESIDEAKKLLKMTMYERLASVDTYLKDPAQMDALLDALVSISLMGLRISAQKSNFKSTNKFYVICKNISKAKNSLGSNPNSKLMLTNLMLNI